MKKFYIVNDYKDLLSGKVIPHKVLDYLPTGIISPIIQPVPVKKYTGLTISSESPIMPVISPFGYDPYSNVSITRTPLLPGFGSQTVVGQGGIYGPPIIKLSPFMNQGMNGTVKIISDNGIFTLNVPFQNLRSVVNYIYMNAQSNLDPTKPRVTFRIITPTIDSSISTTFEKMFEIVKVINTNYSNVTYLTPDGRQSNVNSLLQLLSSLLNKNTNTNTQNINTPSLPLKYKVQIKGNFSSLVANATIGGPEKQILNDVQGGGIIPYYIDVSGNHFLMGYDPSQLLWKWFGGGKEPYDNNPREIAFREAIEETCKLPTMNDCYLTFSPDLINAMENGIGVCVPKQDNVTLKWSNVYFIKIDKLAWMAKYGGGINKYVDIPLGQIKNNEVNRIEWFTEAELRVKGNVQPLLKSIFNTYTPLTL